MPRFRKDSPLRRDLHACTGDGMTYSFMVGTGETYFAAFALALGSSEKAAGLVAAVPPLVGATAQLFAPRLAARVGSPSRWIRGCALLQVASFVPMIVGALLGALPVWVLFVVAGVYWTSALGAAGVWNTWIGLCFPAKIRPHYFGIRSRLCQATLLAALVLAGVIWQSTDGTRWELAGFAVLFVLAAAARAASIPYLRVQRDPPSWPEHRNVPLWHFLANFWHRADARLLSLMLVMQVAVQMGQPFLNPYLLKQLNASPAMYLGLIGASFAAKSAALPLLGAYAKRRGARSLLALGALGTALMILPWMFAESAPWWFAIQAVSGVAQGAWELATFLLLLETIPSDERTSAMSGFFFLNSLAMAVGAYVGSVLLGLAPDAASYSALFGISTVARVGALLLLPFVHVEVLRAIPLISSTLAVRLNAGSIEAPIPDSMDERTKRGEGGP
ncbi:MAG: MFS transporter [Planctomycetota bacterium]